jgi:hypothetical protein
MYDLNFLKHAVICVVSRSPAPVAGDEDDELETLRERTREHSGTREGLVPLTNAAFVDSIAEYK